MPAEPDTYHSAINSLLAEKMEIGFKHQRQAFLAEGNVRYRTRLNRLERAMTILIDRRDDFVEALNSDFGSRSPHQSLLTDIVASLEPFKFAKAHLRRWMQPEKRKVSMPLGMMGTEAWVIPQPMGVVGLVSPWNFPVQLTFAPLAGILAAGNRVMIKPSQHVPATSELLKEVFTEYYDSSEVLVITGDVEASRIFTSLPFDHLIYTGNAYAAKEIIRRSADNLTRLTLGLGGKSPVVIGRGGPLWQPARRIMMGKLINAGQACLAPDYLLLPRGKVEEFIECAEVAIAKMFPTLLDNSDYSSIISERHYLRLQSHLEDARTKGGTVVTVNPEKEDFVGQKHYKMPPSFVIDPHETMNVMKGEIFGPILPIKEYDSLDEAILYINSHARPLAIYYFGNDQREEDELLDRTVSGTLVFNDVGSQIAQEDLPFGGVGGSGQGCYRGKEGFLNFSHRKSVFRQSKMDVAKRNGIVPPWNNSKFAYLIKRMLRR